MIQKIKMTVAGTSNPGLKVAIGVEAGGEAKEALAEMALTFYRILTKRFQHYFSPIPGTGEEPEELSVLFEDDVEEDEVEEAWDNEEEEEDEDDSEFEQELKYK